MGNFSIVKDDHEGKRSIWDIFQIDAFNLAKEGVAIPIEDVKKIIEKHQFTEAVRDVELMSDIFEAIYIAIGGTEENSVREVAAITYLVLATPNFRYMDIHQSLVHAIHSTATFAYLEDKGETVPLQYLTDIYDLIKDAGIYSAVVDMYPKVNVDSKMSAEHYDRWIKSMTDDIIPYVKGVNATRNAFK